MRSRFSVEELQSATLAPPFSFTKGCQTLKLEARPWMNPHPFGTLLFDLKHDPGQHSPLQSDEIEAYMRAHLLELMQANDAPREQYERLGLPSPRQLDGN